MRLTVSLASLCFLMMTITFGSARVAQATSCPCWTTERIVEACANMEGIYFEARLSMYLRCWPAGSEEEIELYGTEDIEARFRTTSSVCQVTALGSGDRQDHTFGLAAEELEPACRANLQEAQRTLNFAQ